MEGYFYEGKTTTKIEIFTLIVYSVYNLAIVSYAEVNNWPDWINYMVIVCCVCSWALFIGKVKDYHFRAFASAILVQTGIILYSINLDDIRNILPILLAFVVFFSLYGIAEVIYVMVASVSIILLWNIIFMGKIQFDSLYDVVTLALQFGNIYLVEYVLYIYTKRNREGSRYLTDVIRELREVEHSKDDFLANVSHEIRTPINTICGMSEIVLQEELPYKVKENVQDIEAAGRNLMSIVSDILDFSELRSGKIELEEEAYNIASTINDVINTALAKKSDKIELIVDCDANIPCALLGDEKKIRRVILNVLDNALKFTVAGCISIKISYRKESYGINLVVRVRDTGIGIEEENLEKIFTSFSQADTSRKRMEGGLGLGLAITHTLVHKMGGAITIKSKPGKGTTVQLVIPQKVLDEAPVASISNRANVNVATYIDLEQFDMMQIRDEYTKSILHMVEQLKGRCCICRNFNELQRRVEEERFSHIFISVAEYRSNAEYFDRLAAMTKLVVVLDRCDEKYIQNPDVLKIYKPYYILTIVSVLNGRYDEKNQRNSTRIKFVTRDAHVLVVDDNRMNLRVIEGLLQDYEVKVTKAASGKEALEKIITEAYDFVFMDHMMPEMDGVETLQRIRHKVGAYYQKVPIVALTANAVAGTREMLMATGFSDFLEKPIERSVLERVLKRNIASEKIVYHSEHISPEHGADVNEQLTDNDYISEFAGELNEKTLQKMLEPEGLDVSKGILYCNGLEHYVDILRGYCEECDDSGMLANELFKKQEWKDYTIAVHGMKSAMRSIGAIKISEIARKLEMAGKDGEISYILENHGELISEYKRLFDSLRKNKILFPELAVNEATNEVGEKSEASLKELNEGDFDAILRLMEEAMYAQDGELLGEFITELSGCKYNGQSMAKELIPVKRKVVMSDYASAVEAVNKIKKRMTDKR